MERKKKTFKDRKCGALDEGLFKRQKRSKATLQKKRRLTYSYVFMIAAFMSAQAIVQCRKN